MPPSNNIDNSPAFWELELSQPQLTDWLTQTIREAATANKIAATDTNTPQLLYNHLTTAVQALTVTEVAVEVTQQDEDDDDEDEDVPRRKKRKALKKHLLRDPHKIWFQTNSDATAAASTDDDEVEWDDDQDDIPDTVGGRLAVLSVGGFLNGLAGIPLTKTPNANPKALFKQAVTNGTAKLLTERFGNSNITVLTLHATATQLHRAVADQVQTDILRTTPRRIQNLLAGDLTNAEFVAARKRVYDTVILGKGLHENADDEDDLPVSSAAVHDIEKFKKCGTCGNNNQSDFVLDRKNGDVICSNCGTVVSESIMHEGSQFRKFEGEVDRNHHGDTHNPLLSNAHNMGTSLSGVLPSTGAGIGGWGSSTATGNKRNWETILKNAHAFTELNVSQFGKTDRRTRVGYKDRQKKDAFLQMMHAGDALNLHEAVVQRAKEIFAGELCE